MRSLWATVYGHQKRLKVGQGVHVWTYRTSSILVGLRFRLKQLQKWSKLEDRLHELYEWIPEVSMSAIGNVVGEFYDKGIRKIPQRMQKCIHRNGDYVEK